MKKFIPLIAVVLLAAACKDEPANEVKHGDQLVFKTEDTIFRDGDLIGVSMDSPLSFVNVKMSYSAGALAPAGKLYWPVDMPDSAVTFLAYYPYSAEYNDGGNVVFTASPDQTTDDAFRASALRVSLTKASVTQPAVQFAFSPEMAKVVFYVKNDSGSPLKDVFFTAYPSVQFNMDKATFRVCGEKVDIHAHLSATSAEGVQAYEAIIAPQNATLSLTLKTDAGEYSAIMDTKTSFQGGKQYSNARLAVLEAGKANRPVNFKIEEAAWKEAPDFVYQEPLAGGAELGELTDMGIYRIVNGVAVPLRTYEVGYDQYSLLQGNQKAGWRLQNPAAGEMFELSSPMTYSVEGNSVEINIRSFGIEGFESSFSSTASVVKFADGQAWLLDENKEYGYIIASE